MSQRVRTVLSFVGFFAVIGILMSDRFQDVSDAVPESLYFWVIAMLVSGMTVLGFYSWWRQYNGRKMHPAIERVKKSLESPSWWTWPF
jgi:hypothetical protein